jgi:hypothetical protein
MGLHLGGGGGRNRISKELGGRVIVERFESHAPERWSGMSVSVFDDQNGWRQTWVDSAGNYWAFRGSPHDDGFSFETVDVEGDVEVSKRMVFSGIGREELDWRWERSSDAGSTWEVLWSIRYRREGEDRT